MYYIVDFESLSIDEETYNKLMEDAEFCRSWIQENASIDQIIPGDEK